MGKNIVFRYVVSVKGIKMDEDEVKHIQERHTPKSIIEVRSFHDLFNFYHKFVK